MDEWEVIRECLITDVCIITPEYTCTHLHQVSRHPPPLTRGGWRCDDPEILHLLWPCPFAFSSRRINIQDTSCCTRQGSISNNTHLSAIYHVYVYLACVVLINWYLNPFINQSKNLLQKQILTVFAVYIVVDWRVVFSARFPEWSPGTLLWAAIRRKTDLILIWRHSATVWSPDTPIYSILLICEIMGINHALDEDLTKTLTTALDSGLKSSECLVSF